MVECTADCELVDWSKSQIIETKTLKALFSDAKGYKAALEDLVKAQKELSESSNKLIKVLGSLATAKTELAEISQPPWYKSKEVWGSVGLVIGVIATTSIALSAQK